MSSEKVTCLSTQVKTFGTDRIRISHWSDGTKTIAHLVLGGEAGVASRKGKPIFERLASIEVPPAFADWISDAFGLLPAKRAGNTKPLASPCRCGGISVAGAFVHAETCEKRAAIHPHPPLSPSTPMLSLRLDAGLSKAAMARARGVTPPTIDDSEAAGGGVSVATLAKAAEALGGRLELHFVPGK